MKVPILGQPARHVERTSPLREFCTMMSDKYQNPNHISTEIFAGEFIKFFDLPEHVCLEDIERLCSCAHVATEAQDLPSELKGANAAYDGQLLIYYPHSRWEGLQLVSLLHELREIISYIFTKINPAIPAPKKLQSLSEAFAAAVIMQKPTFITDTMRSFFNPISLQRKYGLSYHFILYRIVRVFDKLIPLSVSLFQNGKLLALSDSASSWNDYGDSVRTVDEPEAPESFGLTLSLQTTKFNLKDFLPLYHRFIPKKNSTMLSCQHALDVLEFGEHVLDRRYPLPGSSDYPQIREAELICDGFLSTHFGVPANIILVSIPECFRRKYDLKYVNPRQDPLMRNIKVMGEVFESIIQDAVV